MENTFQMKQMMHQVIEYNIGEKLINYYQMIFHYSSCWWNKLVLQKYYNTY